MRRALLLILAATVLVVSGWTAMAAVSADLALDETVERVVDGSGLVELGGAGLPEAVTAAPVLSVVPTGRLLVDRSDAMVVACVLLLAALGALEDRTVGLLRRGALGLRPTSAPILSEAPRRGPPAGLARPFGT